MNNNPSGKFRLMIAGAILFAPVAANASTAIFDNMGQTDGGGASATSNFLLAQRFNTDNADLTLSSISLRLGPVPVAGNFGVSIGADASGLPGSNLVTLGFFSAAQTGSVIDWVDSGLSISGIFSPNTNYWVVMGLAPASPGNIEWQQAATTAGSGPGFQTASAGSSNGGGSWIVQPNSPFKMQVVMIPEPGCAALLFGGLFLLGGRRFRR